MSKVGPHLTRDKDHKMRFYYKNECIGYSSVNLASNRTVLIRDNRPNWSMPKFYLSMGIRDCGELK